MNIFISIQEIFSEILSSEVAWHKENDTVTMTCLRGIVEYKDQNKSTSQGFISNPNRSQTLPLIVQMVGN